MKKLIVATILTFLTFTSNVESKPNKPTEQPSRSLEILIRTETYSMRVNMKSSEVEETPAQPAGAWRAIVPMGQNKHIMSQDTGGGTSFAIDFYSSEKTLPQVTTKIVANNNLSYSGGICTVDDKPVAWSGMCTPIAKEDDHIIFTCMKITTFCHPTKETQKDKKLVVPDDLTAS